MTKKLNVIIMAAGKGTRMNSEVPKVLHKILGRTLLEHVIDQANFFQPSEIAIIVGFKREVVQNSINGKFTFVTQEPQMGTGHAIQECLKQAPQLFENADVIVLSGDTPFVPKSGLEFLKTNQKNCLLSMIAKPGHQYGRILGCPSEIIGQNFVASGIKEHKDCSEAERKINIVNPAIYRFEGEYIKNNILNLKPNNAQKELYLTDLVQKFDSVVCEEFSGLNSLQELVTLEQDIYRKRNEELLKQGVRIQCLNTIRIDHLVQIESDVTIEQGTVIKATKKVSIKRGTLIEQGNYIVDSDIGENCHLKPMNVITESKIGKNVAVGPFCHLRPGSEIADEAKLGNFVEIKKSKIGKKSKVSHLSYLGDASVGENVNVGCGFITCNYDGFNKHQTTIEDDAFIGSDVQAVAPLKVGKGAYVASGTTLNKDVPSDALAIARTKQENKEGYASKLKSRFKNRK